MAVACPVTCALLACDPRTSHHAKVLHRAKMGLSDAAIAEKDYRSFPPGTRIVSPELNSPGSNLGAKANHLPQKVLGASLTDHVSLMYPWI